MEKMTLAAFIRQHLLEHPASSVDETTKEYRLYRDDLNWKNGQTLEQSVKLRVLEHKLNQTEQRIHDLIDEISVQGIYISDLEKRLGLDGKDPTAGPVGGIGS